MDTDRKQFKVKKHKHYETVGRLGGGYVVGGIPWYNIYYGGFWGANAPGNDHSPNETSQNDFGQELSNGGNVGGSTGATAADGGGAGAV